MKKIFCLMAVITVFAGCVNLKTREEMSAHEQKQIAQEQTIQQQRAQAETRQQEYDEQIRVMNSRIDNLTTTVQQLAQSKDDTAAHEQKLREAQDQKIKALEEALVKQEAEIQALQKAREEALTPKKDPLAEADEAFSKKDWKQAIVVYQAFRDKNPKSKKYAEVTFKMGQAFQELGMKAEAKSFYEEVVDKYPSSGEAKKAKSKLKALKK